MTLIYMILILSVVIFIHEFGHFIFAKRANIYVYEFSLGMGPRIFKFNRKNDETDYCIRLFPIGGFVQMAGEEVDDDEKVPNDRKLYSKTILERFLTIGAGIFFNFVLAIVLLFVVGLVNGCSINKPYIKSIEEGVNSNINVGDKIYSVNGKKVLFTDILVLDLQVNSGKPIDMVLINSEGEKYDVTIEPTIVNEDGKEIYKYGIGLGDDVETGVLASIKYAFSKFASLICQMVMVIFYLFTGKLGLNSLSGPVGIFNVVGETAALGFINLVYLTAFLSVNVGFMNLVPIPALDGCRLLFLLIEKIKGSKVDAKYENFIHAVGFVLLMILMVVVTFNDVIKLF